MLSSAEAVLPSICRFTVPVGAVVLHQILRVVLSMKLFYNKYSLRVWDHMPHALFAIHSC